ncbi:CBS domain-containing protein [Neomoorella humiferrea]|uniref:Hypoxic response protein 1 n=1 Tax=Neomoorella humiferrea TaxID=676965 RepID=A0A2T0AVW7_9FIRM|nr:CBS domain-containing protein [Moorella humiferrea]PRR74855.1 Hypoxic response protein 1 [Moorella humiferrea]
MRAKDIMTKDVITISAYAPIYELTKLLAENDISGVPVCDESGKVIGMVSEADLIALKNGSRVVDIMNPEVIAVSQETPVEEVAVVLHTKKIKRVPVYEKDQMVGIISRADIVAAMARKHMERVKR